MYVIAATWYDEFNHPYLTEMFEGSLDETEILTFYEKQKAVYGRTVIGSYPVTRIFSDGSRVILRLHEVKQTIDEDQAITTVALKELE